jgi:hypothetical protein
MKRCLLGVVVLFSIVGAAYAAPLTPTINSSDINFGAEFAYSTNGANPDTLFSSKENLGEEATAIWPNWPSTAGVQPIWYTLPSGAPVFGGDVQLALVLTGHDETPPPLDVSLTGTGAAQGADLMIYGTLVQGQPNVLLWAIDFNVTKNPGVPGKVSLYGYANSPAYVLEGEGLIVGGTLAADKKLIGESGVVRGNIDLKLKDSIPSGFLGFPARYDPASNVSVQVGGSYSGETGAGFSVPEPVTLVLLALGGVAGLWRRPSHA